MMFEPEEEDLEDLFDQVKQVMHLLDPPSHPERDPNLDRMISSAQLSLLTAQTTLLYRILEQLKKLNSKPERPSPITR